MQHPTTPMPFRSNRLSSERELRGLPVERGRTPHDYEYQVLTVPPGSSISQVRATLTEQSEYGRWDLVRTRLYLGGGKKVWMRRRIIRVASTLQTSRTP